MIAHDLIVTIKHFRDFLEINRNLYFNHPFIQEPIDSLNIELCSICNLNCCFCAYGKKKTLRHIMSNNFFFDVIEQATDKGYTKFGLTPTTGDVFIDPGFLDKLLFLENHNRVREYSFFTNFILPNEEKIYRLLTLKKMKELIVSVYGHDEQSFKNLTRSNSVSYRRLIANLNYFKEHVYLAPYTIEIGWRTYSTLKTMGMSELAEIINTMKNQCGIRVRRSKSYNNWGGIITQDDVQGLDVVLGDQCHVYKKGACSLLFNRLQVMANGIVNACACRDVNATLQIGDLNKEPLSHIVSSKNDRYMSIIENQQKGVYNDVCSNCDFYKSIYRHRSAFWGNKNYLSSVEEFKQRIDSAISSKNVDEYVT